MRGVPNLAAVGYEADEVVYDFLPVGGYVVWRLVAALGHGVDHVNEYDGGGLWVELQCVRHIQNSGRTTQEFRSPSGELRV